MSNVLTAETRAARREEITRTTLTLMLTWGPGVTADQIALRCNFGKGTLYLYFTSKAELMKSVYYLGREMLVGGTLPAEDAVRVAHLLLEIEMLDRNGFARRAGKRLPVWVTELLEATA